MKKCGFLKFHSNRIRGHSFRSNWLKFRPDTPYIISNKVTEVFLDILISLDLMLIFHQMTPPLLTVDKNQKDEDNK